MDHYCEVSVNRLGYPTPRSNIVALSATGCLVRRLDIKSSKASYRLTKAETGSTSRESRAHDLPRRARRLVSSLTAGRKSALRLFRGGFTRANSRRNSPRGGTLHSSELWRHVCSSPDRSAHRASSSQEGLSRRYFSGVTLKTRRFTAGSGARRRERKADRIHTRTHGADR